MLDRVRSATRPKWAWEILSTLAAGPCRFSDLLRTITVSSGQIVHGRTLTGTLKELQRQELVVHHQDRSHADYRLTASGRRLVGALADLETWDQQHPCER